MLTPIKWFRQKLNSGIETQVANVKKELNTQLDDFINENSARIQNIDHLAQATHAVAVDLAKRLDAMNYKIQGEELKLEDLARRMDWIQGELEIQSSRIRANPFTNVNFPVKSRRDGRPTLGFSENSGGTYSDFADAFRPDFDDLVAGLKYLTTWLPHQGIGVDLGAGRGEMVKVMTEHGLAAYGIDMDSSMVEAAASHGLEVRLSTVDDFLDSSEQSSVSALTAIQVVEHVDTPTLQGWFKKARQILVDGGVFIAETPNPHAIDAFKAFWVDVTHVRPYYPESLLHMAQAAGFSSAEIWAPGEQESVYDRLGYAGSYAIIAVA